MIKKIFFILSILTFSTFAFAEIELLPAENTKPRQSIQIELARSFNRGVERNTTFVAGEYIFDFEPFFAFAGVQSKNNLFDAVLRTEYNPFFVPCKKTQWHFGNSFAYHFQKDSDYYKEHDFILEFSGIWKCKNNLTFKVRSGYSWRLTYFPTISNFHITDGDLTIINEIDKIWNCGIEIFGSLGSYNAFHYPLFFCPQITFGVAYNIDDVLRFAIQGEIGTTDFLASVMYTNYALMRFNVRISF